jgi:hypothetical protein
MAFKDLLLVLITYPEATTASEIHESVWMHGFRPSPVS